MSDEDRVYTAEGREFEAGGLIYTEMATPYVSDHSPLADGPRLFVAAASGGWTTTPTAVAALLIAMQRALAGTAGARSRRRLRAP